MIAAIESYGLIGDCQTTALIGRDGSIDWLCWPRFDSDACFAALLGKYMSVHKPKPYKCSICGAEVPDLPMPVLKHQLSHVRRRAFAGDQPVSRESYHGEPTERSSNTPSK
jgi:GH15 family glucan-1,4-alpha-glucosidase